MKSRHHKAIKAIKKARGIRGPVQFVSPEDYMRATYAQPAKSSWEAHLDTLERLLILHHSDRAQGITGEWFEFCEHCGDEAPCPTVVIVEDALDEMVNP